MEGLYIHLSLREGVTRDVLEQFSRADRQSGLEFESNNNSDHLSYKGDSTDRDWKDLNYEDAISRFVSGSDHGALKILDPGIPIRYTVTRYRDQIDLTLYQNYWRDEFGQSDAATESIIDLIMSVHTSLPCYHVRTLLKPIPEFERDREQESQGEWVYKNSDKISWITVFGSEGIDRHGRERLLSAPVWRAEDVNDTGILLILTENPADLHSYKQRYNSVRSHLNLAHLPEAT